MNSIEQSVTVNEANLALESVIVIGMPSPAPQLDFIESLRKHWPEYPMEAALLGTFMVSACLFGALYEFPGSPVRQAIASGFLRRTLMGLSMGSPRSPSSIHLGENNREHTSIPRSR